MNILSWAINCSLGISLIFSLGFMFKSSDVGIMIANMVGADNFLMAVLKIYSMLEVSVIVLFIIFMISCIVQDLKKDGIKSVS